MLHCLHHNSIELLKVNDELLECPYCKRQYFVFNGIPIMFDNHELITHSKHISKEISALGIKKITARKSNPAFEITSIKYAILELLKMLARLSEQVLRKWIYLYVLKMRDRLVIRDGNLLHVKKSYEYFNCPSMYYDDDSAMCLGIDSDKYFKYNSRYAREQIANQIFKCCISRDSEVKRICEVGCGSGLTLSTMLELYPDYFLSKAFWAIDFSFSHIFLSFLRFQNLDAKITCFNGDARTLPFPDKFFDLSYTVHVLEQMGHTESIRALKEILRVSKNVILFEPFYDIQSLWGRIYNLGMDYFRLNLYEHLSEKEYKIERSILNLDYKNKTAIIAIGRL